MVSLVPPPSIPQSFHIPLTAANHTHALSHSQLTSTIRVMYVLRFLLFPLEQWCVSREQRGPSKRSDGRYWTPSHYCGGVHALVHSLVHFRESDG